MLFDAFIDVDVHIETLAPEQLFDLWSCCSFW